MDVLHILNHLNKAEQDNGAAPERPLTNADNPLDVNGSGRVTNADRDLVVLALNENEPRDPSAARDETSAAIFLDVNGDGHVSPSDALAISNQLDGETAKADAKGESASGSQMNLTAPLHVDVDSLLTGIAEDVHQAWYS